MGCYSWHWSADTASTLQHIDPLIQPVLSLICLSLITLTATNDSFALMFVCLFYLFLLFFLGGGGDYHLPCGLWGMLQQAMHNMMSPIVHVVSAKCPSPTCLCHCVWSPALTRPCLSVFLRQLDSAEQATAAMETLKRTKWAWPSPTRANFRNHWLKNCDHHGKPSSDAIGTNIAVNNQISIRPWCYQGPPHVPVI